MEASLYQILQILSVTLFEKTPDEVAVAIALFIAAKGKVKTLTMRAFTEKEFSEIVKKVV